MYGESLYLTSGVTGGATGMALAATQGVSAIAMILTGVTVAFTLMLLIRIARCGIAWLAAAFGLWSLQPWAWMFAIIVAGFSLFEAILWMIEYWGSGIGLAASLLPIIILVYLNSREVKRAFGIGAADEAA